MNAFENFLFSLYEVSGRRAWRANFVKNTVKNIPPPLVIDGCLPYAGRKHG